MMTIIFLTILILGLGFAAIRMATRSQKDNIITPKTYLDASKYTSRLPHGLIVGEKLEDDSAIVVKIKSKYPVYGYCGIAENGIITPSTISTVSESYSQNNHSHTLIFSKCCNVLKEMKFPGFKPVFVPSIGEHLCVVNAPYKDLVEVFEIKTNVKEHNYLPNVNIMRQTKLCEIIFGQNVLSKIIKSVGARKITSTHPVSLFDNKENFIAHSKSQTITNLHDGLTRFISNEINLSSGDSMFIAYANHRTLFSDLYVIDQNNNIIAGKLSKHPEVPETGPKTAINITEFSTVQDSKVRIVEDIYDILTPDPTTPFTAFAMVCSQSSSYKNDNE